MASPVEAFFALGDKVTNNDPKRKLDFDYYLLWVMFLAFFLMFGLNLWNFFQTQQWTYITWVLLGIAMMWFQYGSLKQIYMMRKMMYGQKNQPELKVENVDDMLKQFGEKPHGNTTHNA